MNVSRMPSASRPGSLPGYPGLATISIAALLAIGFFVDVALPYLRLDPEVLARYWPRRWWLLVHIAAGAVALLTGPAQLWLGISGRWTRWHRRLGLTYVTSVAVSSVAAFSLAAQTNLGWVFGAGITGLGIAWLVTTAMAMAAIRRGSIDQHREWMIRSYVVTFAFVTFRVVWSVLQAAGLGTLHEQLAASSWFCWAAPLLVTEAVLQGRKSSPRATRARSPWRCSCSVCRPSALRRQGSPGPTWRASWRTSRVASSPAVSSLSSTPRRPSPARSRRTRTAGSGCRRCPSAAIRSRSNARVSRPSGGRASCSCSVSPPCSSSP